MFLRYVMNVKYILISLLVISAHLTVLADSNDQRRQQIIDVIDEEISELSRMVKATGKRSGEELLRLAELNLEKARLIHEKANANILSNPDQKKSKINKKSYFSKSSRYFCVFGLRPPVRAWPKTPESGVFNIY